MKIKLRYVKAYVDQHGKARYYFRRLGFPRVTLPDPLISWPEFMRVYEEASAGQPARVGAARVRPGSMHALAVSYYASPEFLAMRSSSQRVRKNVIERWCRETDIKGMCNGDKLAAHLQRQHVVHFISAWARAPYSANALGAAHAHATRHRHRMA